MNLFALHAHNTILVERTLHAVFARRLGRDASPREREQMTNHFVTSSRYERLFWDQAYRLAEWPL